MTREQALEKARSILKGIDQDESDDNDGWWETSKGASFGTAKLAEIEELIVELSAPTKPAIMWDKWGPDPSP